MENEKIFEAFYHRLRLRVSGICLNNNSEVLLIRHKYPGERGYLLAPPGGEMNFGEQAHEALKREFKEETHLNIEVGPLLFVHEFKDKKLHAVELFFKVFAKNDQNLSIGLDPELQSNQQIITHVQWMSMESIKTHKKQSLHFCLRELSKVSDLLEMNGYSSELH